MFTEVNESVENKIKDYQNWLCILIKDQIELVEMWNTAIFIKKSVGGIRRRLDTAKEVSEQ